MVTFAHGGVHCSWWCLPRKLWLQPCPSEILLLKLHQLGMQRVLFFFFGSATNAFQLPGRLLFSETFFQIALPHFSLYDSLRPFGMYLSQTISIIYQVSDCLATWGRKAFLAYSLKVASAFTESMCTTAAPSRILTSNIFGESGKLSSKRTADKIRQFHYGVSLDRKCQVLDGSHVWKMSAPCCYVTM